MKAIRGLVWLITNRVLILFLLSLSFSADAYATEQVSGLRIWGGPEKTRLVLDVSGSVDYKLFSLPNPNRIVVDLRSTRLLGEIGLPANSSSLVKGVRAGVRNQTDLRIVFDIAGKVRPKSFILKPAQQYGHRLVLDLFPEKQSSVPRRPVAVALQTQRDIVIAIDAGHGGEDPGAIGASGTHEKRVTLEIARVLADLVRKEPGMTPVMIRNGDYYVARRSRSEKARKHRADIFISIHADSFYNKKVQGSSVYVLSRNGASSEAALWLAKKANQADLVGGVKLDDKEAVLASVLLDLSQNATQEASNAVAQKVHLAMAKVGKTHKKRVERAAFVVLKSPDIPSLLVETAYISNPAEERRLKSKKHQRKLAKAILGGIREYFYAVPPPGTWIAARSQSSLYKVRRGDTLSGIASQYQISLANLKSVNQIKSDRIRIGKQLIIPAI